MGWVVDAGSDFPYELRAIISSWQTGVLLRPRDGLTTKGWNGYGANEHRGTLYPSSPNISVLTKAFQAFRYLTPKLRITASDLSKSLLTSKSFHLICAPERCIELVTSIKALRSNLPTPLPAPLFIWEPVPDLCVPSQLETTIQALSHVDILSPNHAELADLCGVSADTTAGDVDRSVVEQCAVRLLSGAAKTISTHNPAVVVRSGKSGCLVASSSHNVWLPAYHATNPDKVIDPTGGGNGFLGGFAVGLVRTGDLVQAAVWGNVGASLCIEQVGVPVLGIGKDGAETWNGVNVQVRLSDALKRSGM